MKIYRSVATPLDERGKRFARVEWVEEWDRDQEVEGYRMQNSSGRPRKKRPFEAPRRKRRLPRVFARKAA